jgi:hypothetical protein
MGTDPCPMKSVFSPRWGKPIAGNFGIKRAAVTRFPNRGFLPRWQKLLMPEAGRVTTDATPQRVFAV